MATLLDSIAGNVTFTDDALWAFVDDRAGRIWPPVGVAHLLFRDSMLNLRLELLESSSTHASSRMFCCATLGPPWLRWGRFPGAHCPPRGRPQNVAHWLASTSMLLPVHLFNESGTIPSMTTVAVGLTWHGGCPWGYPSCKWEVARLPDTHATLLGLRLPPGARILQEGAMTALTAMTAMIALTAGGGCYVRAPGIR
jgi:hypothetical protein